MCAAVRKIEQKRRGPRFCRLCGRVWDGLTGSEMCDLAGGAKGWGAARACLDIRIRRKKSPRWLGKKRANRAFPAMRGRRPGRWPRVWLAGGDGAAAAISGGAAAAADGPSDDGLVSGTGRTTTTTRVVVSWRKIAC